MIKAYFKQPEKETSFIDRSQGVNIYECLVFETLNKNLVTKVDGVEIVFLSSNNFATFQVVETPCYDKLINENKVKPIKVRFTNITRIPINFTTLQVEEFLKQLNP